MTKTITIGRLDNLQIATVNDDATIKQAFESKDISLDDGEKFQDLEKNDLTGNETVTAGSTYLIVESMKSRGI